MLYNTACLCEYAGTAYSGWQRQKNGRSIQEILETALEVVYKHPIKIAGSGRTDAGVHAMGQVFSYRSEVFRKPETVVKALNGLLPRDIAILDAVSTCRKFHAGLNVVSKTYTYKIINRSVPSALYSERALWIRRPLDTDYINELLKPTEGEHDFSSFCVKKTKKENTVRRINFAKAVRNGEIIDIEINSSGFLHNMVRIIVGTVLKASSMQWTPGKIEEILTAKDRRAAGPTAAPYALYQKEVFYGNSGESGLSGIPAANLKESETAEFTA